MRIFRFDASTGRPITVFGSVSVAISPILRGVGAIQTGCMHIGPGGVIGAHPAVGPQLFLVVAGEGWVRGARGARRPIIAGQAAFWEDGEEHESGSETGMTAVVIEGAGLAGLDPAQCMPELAEG
jgi:hypothetical protein